MQVEWEAVGEGDAGVLDAAVGGEQDGSGGGDLGLVAVADEAGEPVVGEADGGGGHEQEVLGGGGVGGGGERGGGGVAGVGGDGGEAGVGDARRWSGRW